MRADTPEKLPHRLKESSMREKWACLSNYGQGTDLTGSGPFIPILSCVTVCMRLEDRGEI